MPKIKNKLPAQYVVHIAASISNYLPQGKEIIIIIVNSNALDEAQMASTLPTPKDINECLTNVLNSSISAQIK